MLKREKLAAGSQLPIGDVQTLYQPLLKRAIPAALQSSARPTEAGSAAMVVSQTMAFCATQLGVMKSSSMASFCVPVSITRW